MGPMRAAHRWATETLLSPDDEQQQRVASLSVALYGSLAATGEGHGTPGAILAGLEGCLPATVETTSMIQRRTRIQNEGSLLLANGRRIKFNGISFHPDKFLPGHSNAMRFSTFDSNTDLIASSLWYSVGGGFIVADGEDPSKSSVVNLPMPLPFRNGTELLAMCKYHRLSIADVVMINETHRRPEEDVRAGLLGIWNVMNESILRGCRSTEDHLPGPLKVKRRAPQLYRHLQSIGSSLDGADTPLENKASGPDIRIDWLSMFAMAVNEENAAGSRMVTAPTNGAAGVIPAVFKYFRKFSERTSESPDTCSDNVIEYLMTAGAMGMLAKKNASISAAEAGCQAEIGVASSMAAAGLVHLYGGSPQQCEAAAEIAMEHSLGLSCDPIGGLVQVPCIERNSVGALKALGAARLALHVEDEADRRVSLDQVLETMRLTGIDMSTRYKETSMGGLSVVVPLC